MELSSQSKVNEYFNSVGASSNSTKSFAPEMDFNQRKTKLEYDVQSFSNDKKRAASSMDQERVTSEQLHPAKKNMNPSQEKAMLGNIVRCLNLTQEQAEALFRDPLVRTQLLEDFRQPSQMAPMTSGF